MKAAHLLAAMLFAVAPAVSGASASGVAHGAKPPLRIGVPYITPKLTSAEFRVFTEDGFEQDIARQIAENLELQAVFVPISGDSGTALIDAGEVDIVVERLKPQDIASHRQTALDTGFSSAKSVAMRTDTDIKQWSDLGGRIVCVPEASDDAQRIAAKYGARLRIERAPALSLMLVRTGECDAALHDEALLTALFEKPEWQKFSATLQPVEQSALVVEVAPSNPVLQRRVRQVLASLSSDEDWQDRKSRWARNVSFEVYMEQDAPDCH